MRRFFMALLLIGILTAMSLANSQNIAKNLVFLNMPEKVLKPGILGQQTIKNTSNTRIFFHYLNATGQDQVFKLKFEGNFFNFKSSVACDLEPGIAGAKSNIGFFKSKTKIISNPEIKITVPQGFTISGIVEAKLIPGEKWICQMGNGKPLEDLKIVTTNSFQKSINVPLNNNDPYHYRLGFNRSSVIPGDYGYHYNFNVKNKTNSKKLLLCYLNPRGGKITGVFNINDKIISTNEILPKVETKFFHKVLNSQEQVLLEYIPTGGYCYPIQMKFKLIDI